MAAALMVSTIGGFPPSQGEALRLRIPQLLWKVLVRRIFGAVTSFRLVSASSIHFIGKSARDAPVGLLWRAHVMNTVPRSGVIPDMGRLSRADVDATAAVLP